MVSSGILLKRKRNNRFIWLHLLYVNWKKWFEIELKWQKKSDHFNHMRFLNQNKIKHESSLQNYWNLTEMLANFGFNFIQLKCKTWILFIKSRNIVWKIFDVIGFNSIYHLQSKVNEPRVLFVLHTRKIGTQTSIENHQMHGLAQITPSQNTFLMKLPLQLQAYKYYVLQASLCWLFLPIYFHMAVTVHMICEIVTFSISISIYFICD